MSRDSISRWATGSLGVLLLACGGDSLTRAGQNAMPPAAVAIVSGDGQEGTAGEELNRPLVVEVTDAEGEGVPGVPVTWRVTSGAGAVSTVLDPTRFDGRSRTVFVPTAVGRSEVTAEVSTDEFEGAVTFAVDVTVLRIELGDDFGWGTLGFWAPNGSSRATVPVGTTVEWVIQVTSATVTSTTAPPGGAHFDSGTLSGGARFRFVPQVPGTWEYVDGLSGVTARLTAE